MTLQVEITKNVAAYILNIISSASAYGSIEKYCSILSEFPEIGAPYVPSYTAALPPFSCRCFSVPETPFTLYYLVDQEVEKLVIFLVEHRAASSDVRFNWAVIPW